MLKKRIIANLTVLNGVVVQSVGFKKYHPVGSVAVAVEFLNQWGIDEIIIADISATKENRSPLTELYKKVSNRCFVPLTIGGGVRSIDHIHDLLHSGADKIFINNYAFENPDFISKSANIFGDQCIIVAIDVIYKDNKPVIYDYKTRMPSQIDLHDWVKEVENRGAGELLINCVDRDGQYSGYDISLAKQIADSVNVPVIICGGAGKPEHFYEVLSETNVAAVAAGNYFHFSEHSVITTKAFLQKRGLDIRLETFASYNYNYINQDNRLDKLDDEHLEHLLYKKIVKEII
ncbi:imidazole glycerol phosphate synthase subunit HisF [Sediminibacterium goheungense]|uniref:imidazole glycerol-phosphate synthase n=1 Tax=Sediminibacterium goheungense TaxID=1086393 RepID=A0A4R6IYF9_9BACT|nr:imidazole glycerol phosphate synthase cyclase subunit [Sediminibacterium goheungense]TDO26915.1 cyclase [Sediminibacterium goheungense]